MKFQILLFHRKAVRKLNRGLLWNYSTDLVNIWIEFSVPLRTIRIIQTTMQKCVMKISSKKLFVSLHLIHVQNVVWYLKQMKVNVIQVCYTSLNQTDQILVYVPICDVGALCRALARSNIACDGTVNVFFKFNVLINLWDSYSRLKV